MLDKEHMAQQSFMHMEEFLFKVYPMLHKLKHSVGPISHEFCSILDKLFPALAELDIYRNKLFTVYEMENDTDLKNAR